VELDDPRWPSLHGGYRIPYDPRAALAALESSDDPAEAWQQLWEELHHQGKVGEASYAAVPHLVRIHKKRDQPEWQTYGLVGTIEMARRDDRNPPVPAWLSAAYFDAIKELAQFGLTDLKRTDQEETITCILAVLAFWKNVPVSGGFLLRFSEEELQRMEAKWYEE
jgi:hypothetical protein